MIDLHVHSTFSDGSLTPEALVERAARLGVTAVALTDHDNTAGLESFMAACRRDGRVRGVPGVEISADVEQGTLHMLGYLLDPDHARLQSVLKEIRDGRELRNRRILERLCALGMALSWDEVAAYAGSDVVGRPHFAQALVAKGYVASKEAAFRKLLGKGKPAYVDRFRLTSEKSVEVITEAGGVPVLAHPFSLQLGADELRTCVKRLRDLGLQGIEVFYPEHSRAQQRQYSELAADAGLVATGGSDFHGEINPDIEIGKGFGSLAVPDTVLEALLSVQGKKAVSVERS